MSRFLAVLLALTGLTFVATPQAHAAPRRPVDLTIAVSATTIAEGDTVSIQGKARHAVPLTGVELQRLVAGSWTKVKAQRVSATLHYSFTATPRRGVQQYRVLTIRRAHQPVARSSTVAVSVTWHPAIGLTGTPTAHDDGSQWVRLSGVVTDGPDMPTVDLQSRTLDNTTWTTIETFSPGDGTTFSEEEPRSSHRMYRAVLHASTLTPEVTSDFVNSESAPYVLTLGHEAAIPSLPKGPDVATVDLDLTQGQRVTITVGRIPIDWQAKVQGPDLGTIGYLNSACPCGGNAALSFTASLTGTYQIHLSTGSLVVGNWILTASVPVHVDLVQDGPAQAYSSQLAGQDVEASFHADAGDAFTVLDPHSQVPDYASETLIAPDGTTVTPLLRREDNYDYAPVYLAEQSGTYTYRYTPHSSVGTGTIQVRHVPQATAAVDGVPVTVQVTTPGDVHLVWSQTDAGDVVSVAADYLVPVQSLRGTALGWQDDVLGSAGQHLVVVRCCTTDQTGPVTVKVGSPVELTADIDGSPAAYDLTGWRARAVDVSFTGTAGQAVEPIFSTDATRVWMYDAAGNQLPNLDQAFVLPADGTYTMRAYLGGGPGTFGLRSAPIVDVSTDGVPSRLSLTRPYEVALGRITAPAGTRIDATLTDVDESLTTKWYVDILRPDGYLIDFWTESLLSGNRPPDTRPTFTVPADGVVYFALFSSNITMGSVKVSAVIAPG